MKKYRIQSKFRFAIFVIIVSLIVSLAVTTVLGFNTVSGTTKPAYETVLVQDGDTIWSIAERYTSDDKDVRQTVYQIRQENHLDACDIVSGDKIIVPVYD